MKSRLVKTGIGFAVFFAILLTSLYFLSPAYRMINKTVREAESQFLSQFSSLTSLGISYDSLSPSLLSQIRVNNIIVFDVSSGEEILTIRRAVFHYDLFKIIKKDYDSACTKLVISTVNFSFDREKSAAIVEKFRSSKKSKKTQDEGQEIALVIDEHAELLTDRQKDIIRIALQVVPRDIQIKNVFAAYQDERKSFDLHVDKLNLHKQEDKNISLSSTSGYLTAKIAQLKGNTMGARFSFTGNLVPSLSGSSMILTVEQYQKTTYTLYKTQFLVRYRDGSLYACSTQRILPYYVSASYNVATADLAAEFDAQALDIFSVVKVPIKNKKIKDIASAALTAGGHFNANWRQRSYSWDGTGSLDIPESVVKGGEHLEFTASGNRELVQIRSLSLMGLFVSGSVSGSYNIQTKKPTGSVSLSHLRLPNGNNLSCEAYLEAEGNTVKALVPKLHLGEQQFTGIQAVAVPVNGKVDFSVALADPAHRDYGKPGNVKASGSYTWKDGKKLSATLSLDGIFLDSLAKAGAFFTKGRMQQRLLNFVPTLARYITSDEISVSTDFKQISYKVPYMRFASTQGKEQTAFLSFEGTEREVTIPKLELVFSKQHLLASLYGAVSPEDKQLIFNSDISLNEFPYQISGTYTAKKWLTVKGSYGIDVLMNLEDGVKGSAKIASLPVALADYVLRFSAETEFDFSKFDDFSVTINTLQVEEEKGKLNRFPKLTLMGTADKMGVVLNTIDYTDISSSISGMGYVFWSRTDGIFESLTVSLDAGNELTGEILSLEGSFNNPSHSPLTKEHLLHDCYFTVQTNIKDFPLMRVLPGQYADDTFNGFLVASGTLENPYVSMDISNFSVQYGIRPVIAQGRAELIEGAVNIPDFDVVWGNIKLLDLCTNLDLNAFNGDASADLSVSIIGGRVVKLPLKIALRDDVPAAGDAAKKRRVPERFTVTLDSDMTIKGIINGSVPLHVAAQRDGNVVSFASDPSMGVTGSFNIKEGAISARVPRSKPMYATVSGTVKKGVMNIAVGNVYCDFSKFSELVSTDIFSLTQGTLSGQIAISGLSSDPILDGSAVIRNFEMGLPLLSPAPLRARNVLLTMAQNEIELTEARFLVGDGALDTTALVVLDRWGLESASLKAKSPKNSFVPIDMNVPNANVKGYANADVNIGLADNELDINVKAILRDSELTLMNELTDKFSLSNLVSLKQKNKDTEEEEKESLFTALTRSMEVRINIDAEVDRKVNVAIKPLLRALIVPQTKLHFDLDSDREVWNMKSDVVIRGGQIRYLSRNFYIKEGRIELNEQSGNFNPLITARAETREHDENGIPVTIVLEVKNQPLFGDLGGRIYSIPARSENQILAMLGQIVSGDSSNIGALLASGADYMLQLTVLGKIEDALRELCNFDIFSIRANVVRGTMGLFSTSSSRTSSRNPISNFLDNTSVYIGKYFGTSIYADALLQWSYDKNAEEGSSFLNSGIIFRPEIGLELEAPFARIRWDFAPDLGELHNGFMPSIVSATSITLSWSITF